VRAGRVFFVFFVLRWRGLVLWLVDSAVGYVECCVLAENLFFLFLSNCKLVLPPSAECGILEVGWMCVPRDI